MSVIIIIIIIIIISCNLKSYHYCKLNKNSLVSIWSLQSLRSLRKKNVQRSQRSYGNYFPAIVVIAAITIAEIQLLLFQRTLSLRSLESGFHIFAAVAELFSLSDRSGHMETRLNKAIVL